MVSCLPKTGGKSRDYPNQSSSENETSWDGQDRWVKNDLLGKIKSCYIFGELINKVFVSHFYRLRRKDFYGLGVE